MAFNRRLFFWLINAYIKKWRKTILLSFIVGLAFFFILRFVVFNFVTKIPLVHQEIIGSVGAYTVDTLPTFVIQDASRGLTSVDMSGQPHPDLATHWQIADNGKAYIFTLRHNIFFEDGTPFTSKEINYSFSDVAIQRPDPYTIVFRLKEKYAPFLVAISRPIFKSGFVGIGTYKIKDIKLNGPFVVSVTMVKTDNPLQIRLYQFYPTQESLKIAYVLGNITKAVGLSDITFENKNFTNFSNTLVSKQINYKQLVTLFYNTQDRMLSDKILRDGLSYALPNSFAEGIRASLSIPPQSWAYQQSDIRSQDIEHAKELLAGVEKQDKIGPPTITVSVLQDYKPVMDEITKSWAKIGVKTKVIYVKSAPTNGFQVFLGSFNVPQDPDQYTLWHSDQNNNITGYNSARIDQLLEDGRKTLDQSIRLQLYSDFQKYLQDDQPASFLYFPFTYIVSRK